MTGPAGLKVKSNAKPMAALQIVRRSLDRDFVEHEEVVAVDLAAQLNLGVAIPKRLAPRKKEVRAQGTSISTAMIHDGQPW